MSLSEEYDEYVTDDLILFDFGKSESHEECDIHELITIKDEVFIDPSCNFRNKIFEDYINSIVKDTSMLPYSFCKIQENLEYLDLCRPLSIRVTDCDKYPWYEPEMAKIIHNKKLEQNIQSKKNNDLLDSKLMELGKQNKEPIDANDALLNNISDIKFFDIDEKQMSDYYRDSFIFESIDECQNKESSFCDTDDFVIIDKEEDNVKKVKRKINRKVTSTRLFEPCKKIDCISLSMDNKTQLSHLKKLVPHYHKMKDEKNLTIRLNFNELETNSKVLIDTSQNNLKKNKSINKELFETYHTLGADPRVKDEYEVVKSCQETKKPNTKHALTISKQSKKSMKVNPQTKVKKEKLVSNIKEIQNKYFNNSASVFSDKRMIVYSSLPNIHHPTQGNNEKHILQKNSSLKCSGISKKKYDNKNSLLDPKIKNGFIKNNYRYTPYIHKVGKNGKVEENEFNNNLIHCVNQANNSSRNELKKILQKDTTKYIDKKKTFGTSQHYSEGSQTYTNKHEGVATTINIHEKLHPGPPIMDYICISQNNERNTQLEKQIKGSITNPTAYKEVQCDKEGDTVPKYCVTCHGYALVPKAANVRPNLRTLTKIDAGYSPPVLPIPTYKKTFEVLAQVNLKSKYKLSLECRNSSVDVPYNEGILSNRRITLDIQRMKCANCKQKIADNI